MTTREINIVLSPSGEGTLSSDGLGEFPCLGNVETLYPAHVVNNGVEGEEKFPELFSNELQANIERAILLGWEFGLFIHAGADNLNDNDGPSSGNIQLEAANAEKLYEWIDGPTQITIAKES